MLGIGAIRLVQNVSGQLISNIFLVEKKDESISVSQSICALSALQNGRFAFKKLHAKTRFHVQAISQGCSLQPSSPPRISEICPLSVGGEFIRILMLMFRPGPGPTNIQEITESPNGIFALHDDMLLLVLRARDTVIPPFSI